MIRVTTSKRICIIGPLHYESDSRTMRYAEALQKEGNQVDVVCVRKPGEPSFVTIRGVNVHGIRTRKRNEKGKLAYLWRLGIFTVHAGFYVGLLHLRRRFDVVHAHSIPDYIVFSALVPKLTGTKVILDIYDVTPEFYLSKFQARPESVAYKALLLVEKVSCKFADHVISANDLWQTKLTSRAVPEGKCSSFVNYIDLRIFYRHERRRTDDRFIVMYPGILNWHQGVDIAVRAFKLLSEKVPNAEFHIYGDGPEKPHLEALIAELGLEGKALLKDSVPLVEVPQIMADADMGVVGKRADVFGNEAYSTKIAEYMSQGLPTVIPRTAIDSYYFSESEVMFYEPGNHQDMAEKMLTVAGDAELRKRLIENGFGYVERNNWEGKIPDYLSLVYGLANGLENEGELVDAL